MKSRNKKKFEQKQKWRVHSIKYEAFFQLERALQKVKHIDENNSFQMKLKKNNEFCYIFFYLKSSFENLEKEKYEI